jgi:hypothetical protein
MSRYPAEDIRFTRKDLEAIIAEHFAIPANDPRVTEAYKEMVGDHSIYADDPDEFFQLMMSEGYIASEIIADGVRLWVAGRHLL